MMALETGADYRDSFGTFHDQAGSSTTSLVSSTSSSKKVAWLLGVEAVSNEDETSRPPISRGNSALKLEKILGSRVQLRSPQPYTSSDYAEELSDDEESILSDVEMDTSHTAAYNRRDGMVMETDDNIEAARMDWPSVSLPVSVHASHEPHYTLQSADKLVPEPLPTAPDSPDIDSLAVAQFTPSSVEEAKFSSPRFQGDLTSTDEDNAVDFNEICERLLVTLSSPLTRPSFDTENSRTSSTISSSQSSAMIFTGPPTPQLSSCGSSLKSILREEKMATVKSSLVADQAALEAKMKLAAARDALKRVKSNVAAPASDYATTNYPRPAATADRHLSHARTASSSSVGMLRPPPSTLRASRSASAVDELAERPAPRSSRSSRNTHRDPSPQPHKSDFRIGMAAPKDLSVLKNGKDRSPVPIKKSIPVKGKTAMYVPQGHITSIHEVMA